MISFRWRRLLLLTTFPAAIWIQSIEAGTRFELVPTFGPDRVSGARACFSRARESARRTILDHFLSGPETRCITTDKILNLPAGLWHFYVVNDDPFLISAHPTELVRPSDSSDFEGVSRMYSEMLPAAAIRVDAVMKKLGKSETVALYVANAGSDISAPALLPVPPGSTEMPIPANTPVTPLLLRDDRITAVGDTVSLNVGDVGETTFPTRSRTTVVVPFTFPKATKLEQPVTFRVSSRRRSDAYERAYAPGIAEWRGLMFFHDVPAGRLDVVVDSTKVAAAPLSIDVPFASGRVLTTADLVMSTPPQAARLTWSISAPFFSETAQKSICEPEAVRDSPIAPRLTLFACGEKVIRRPVDLTDCMLIRSETLSLSNDGQIQFPLPEVAEVVSQLEYGGISGFARSSVRNGGLTEPAIQLSPSMITGQITFNGQPVVGTISCGGSEQSTDLSGHYRCWRPQYATEVIQIRPCDGSPSYLHEFDPEATTVDVKIPSNSLRVTAFDATTGTELPETVVTLWDGPDAPMSNRNWITLGSTDSSGVMKTSRLRPRFDASVCGFKKGYARVCSDNIDVDAEGEIVVSLRLVPEKTISGRIVGAREIVSGRIHVVTGPVELEETFVGTDGRFELQHAPPRNAAMILTSQTMPLCVLEPAELWPDELRMRIPPLRAGAFTVTSPVRRTPITLELGEVLIPSSAFLRHQSFRKAQYVVAPSHSIEVADVDLSRGVAVVVGLVTPQTAGDARMLPRIAVSGREEVVLPP